MRIGLEYLNGLPQLRGFLIRPNSNGERVRCVYEKIKIESRTEYYNIIYKINRCKKKKKNKGTTR